MAGMAGMARGMGRIWRYGARYGGYGRAGQALRWRYGAGMGGVVVEAMLGVYGVVCVVLHYGRVWGMGYWYSAQKAGGMAAGRLAALWRIACASFGC